MPELKVELTETKNSYHILIDTGIYKNITDLISKQYQGDKILLVTDENVYSYYGEEIISSLSVKYKTIPYILPPGEKAKSYPYLMNGHDILVNNNFNRDHLIIALGGGVVGDLAGFLAATFMRGISLIQVPTTLLAQVDSSVGGKTAINHVGGKNLIGAFYQPRAVIIDTDFLQTLPLRELKTGMAEVIKYGLMADKAFARYLEKHQQEILNYQTGPLEHIITRSCSIKADVVGQDEKEKGIRAILNFGHTIAHAIEAVTSYQRYNHGEAVAVGMIGAGRLSYKLNHITEQELNFLEKLIGQYGLPVNYQYNEDPAEIYQALYHDKKVKDNKIRWILLKQIGQCFVQNAIDPDIIKGVLEELK